MASTNPESISNDAVAAVPQENSSSSIYMGNPEELQKVFDRFDANGDGKISATELRDVLKAMGSDYTENEVQRVMEEVDADRDGFINFQEFSDLCRSNSCDSSAELRDAFDLYDQDHNGLISSSELHLVLNRLGIKCSVEDCVRMIGPVDSDGDGNVNFEEFQKMMTTSLAPAKE
ncbi:probable calcium-binding protein CML27 [Carica papaya]|uniref:Calmodulin-like protein 27 n=1 Tax=Carica papaya TaxID=3649 RepID=A0A3Q8UB72_CARPA|nr:probable calcium-binding protein CML27 [Carica papaya]AZL94061.1 calmodulin-like protein 27 [Carica papaya]